MAYGRIQGVKGRKAKIGKKIKESVQRENEVEKKREGGGGGRR